MSPPRPSLQAPDWWNRFVLVVNDGLLNLIDFLQKFRKVDVLYLTFIAWVLVMWAWIRDYPKFVRILYFVSLTVLVLSYLLFFAPAV